MRIRTSAVLAIAITLALGATAFGDTIELRDGKLVKGQYMGGTATTVRIQVGKETQVIPVANIVAITFDPREGGQQPVAKEPAPQGDKQPPATPPAQVTVPAGTVLLMAMDQTIDSRKHKAGTDFTGKLTAPLQVGDKAVLPIGTPVYGKLVAAKKGGRLARRAELKLELTHILVGDTRVAIATSDVKSKGARQGTARKVGAGAAIGGIVDGKDGAKKGAAIGAGVAVLTRGRQVNVPKGSVLEFKLKHQLVVQSQKK